jgi:enoyl-CoA hydratase/carnithine racemase
VSVLRVDREGRVAVLTLNRPEARNALSTELVDALVEALRSLAGDEGCGCVVLAGEGPSFCAGADLRELRAADPSAFAAYIERLRVLAGAFRDLGRPAIAAVRGHAIAGGFELACLCDMRVVAQDAEMRVGDLEIGLSPTTGLSWTLPRLVGLGRARWLMYAGPTVDGASAVRIGLAEEAVPAPRVRDRAIEIAAHIGAHPGIGVRRTRELLDRGMTSTYDEAVAAELVAEAETFAHPETRAAIAAFFDRRR